MMTILETLLNRVGRAATTLGAGVRAVAGSARRNPLPLLLAGLALVALFRST